MLLFQLLHHRVSSLLLSSYKEFLVMSNLEWSPLSTVKSLWDGVRRLGRVLLPICCGVFGLCLPRQVLKFNCTEYTWDFYPLNCSWACSFLIFSSSLCMRLWGGEEQLCLSYSGVILGITERYGCTVSYRVTQALFIPAGHTRARLNHAPYVVHLALAD